MVSQWRHNLRDGVSNHLRLDCSLGRFQAQMKKISKHRATGLCEGNSPVTGEFLAQRASNAGNVSIWWRHQGRCRRHRRHPALSLPMPVFHDPISMSLLQPSLQNLGHRWINTPHRKLQYIYVFVQVQPRDTSSYASQCPTIKTMHTTITCISACSSY